MSTDVEVAVGGVSTSPPSYQLIARDEQELRGAHAQMIAWAEAKQRECASEASEVETLLNIAVSKGWHFAPYTARLNMLKRRRVFYGKIEAALRAGYVIVPNFQMTVFAIRTDAGAPKGKAEHTGKWNTPRFQQAAKMLEIGDGSYKNPFPTLLQSERQVPEGTGTRTELTTWPDEFTEIMFPMELAKPMIMEQTAAAMDRKLFDEIGVAVDTMGARADPIILGRLLNPKRNGIPMTFFLAWYLDPSRI